jgi:WD40 repeat protein/energy-coupling factor transporter ATP-binding protein EcfA2
MSEFFKNPFPGIRSFEIHDSEFFFGRETQIKDVIDNLNNNKFTAVLGPAGSGKSSLIKAGVIPKIVNTSEKSEWDYIIFSPENNPLANFSKAVYTIAKKYINNLIEEDFERRIAEDTSFLGAIIEKITSVSNKKVLIYIDQFEDIFFYTEKSEKNTLNSLLFIKNILEIIENKNNNFYILTSLKSDYLSSCRDFEGLVEIINKGHYLVPKLNKEQKIEAILKPVLKSNLKISDELLKQIIQDIEVEESQLLVLQHTLKRTWDYHQKNFSNSPQIEIEHYRAIGGVEKSLNNHADEVFQNLESEKSKILVEKIFKALILIKNDYSISRISVLLSDISDITGAKQNDIIKILDEFRNKEVAFIQPSGTDDLNEESIIRISRDIVIAKWTRLNNWITDEKNSVQIYKQISLSAGLYQKGEAKLLVNPELQHGLNWYKTNNPNLNWAKRYDPYFERAINFLEYSKTEYENQIEAHEKKQKRDVKRFRNFAIILGVASLISILFLLFALNLRYEAQNSEKQAKENERLALDKSLIAEEKQKEAVSSKKVAEQQQLIADEQKLIAEEQKLFAVEKQREAIIQKANAEEAKEQAEIAQRKAEILKVQAEELMNQAIIQKNIADDQRIRAEKSELKTDTLRRLSIAKSLAVTSIKLQQSLEQKDENLVTSKEEEQLPKIMAIQAYNFNVFSGGNKSDSEIFNALSVASQNPKTFKSKKNHTEAVRDIAAFSDGENIVSCSDDGTIKIWNTSMYDEVEYIPVILKTESYGNEGLRCLDISPNQENVVCGTSTGAILFWASLSEGIKPQVFTKHYDIINDIAFVNENTIISVSNDKTLIKTNLQNLTSDVVKSFEAKPVCIAISEDKSLFAVADFSGKIYVFSAFDFSEIKNFQSTNIDLSVIGFIGNNKLAIGTFSGSLEIYNLLSNNIIVSAFFAHISGINKISYNKNQSYLGTCSYDGNIKLWDVNNFEKDPIIVNDLTSWVYSICFSNDGEYLFAGSADKTKPILFLNVNSESLYDGLNSKYTENMSEYNWLKYVGPGIEYSTEL